MPDGDAVVPVINDLARGYETVVLTQDWHTADHASFASQHPGQPVFATVEMPYGPQILWPDHCVMGSRGAELHPDLAIPQAQLVLRKGFHRRVDSYSAFLEADGTTPTGLEGYLRARGIGEVHLCGLATDYCVAWSALDARAAGFEAVVFADATRAIDRNGSLAAAWARMDAAGISRATSADITAS